MPTVLFLRPPAWSSQIERSGADAVRLQLRWQSRCGSL